MKAYVKKAFLAGGTLALLSGVMASLIAGADFLTRDTIARNETKKERAGLVRLFGEASEYGEAKPLSDPSFPHLSKYWTVSLSGKEIGRVYRGDGRNAYGEIGLLFGLDARYSLIGVVTLVNTESYAQVLKENYLDPLSSAADKDAAMDAVNCGATFGAKTSRMILLEGKDHYRKGGER